MTENRKIRKRNIQKEMTDMLEIVNSQALTIRAIMEILNLTDEQIQKKGLEIIEKMKASGPYDDEDDYDGDYYDDEDDEDYDEDYDDEDYDDDDDEDYDDEDYDDEDYDDEDPYNYDSNVKSGLNKAGVSIHPSGSFIFGE